MDTKDEGQATPPGGGRQDHYAMRADSMRAVTGPASTDTLAAGGGLELPGGDEHEVRLDTEAPTPEPIPGEHDATTLMHRQPGAMGGQFAGADIPASGGEHMMDRDTARLHRQEGGGGSGKHSA